jgi:hypothetical protein
MKLTDNLGRVAAAAAAAVMIGGIATSAATPASAATTQPAATAQAAPWQAGWWYGWGWGWYTGWHTGMIWSWHDGRWRWWHGRGYGYGYSWFDGWHYNAPWCTATSVNPNDGWPTDRDIHVTSNVPNQSATASSSTDTYSYGTDASGSAIVYLWYQSPGEWVHVTVGGASCWTQDGN